MSKWLFWDSFYPKDCQEIILIVLKYLSACCKITQYVSIQVLNKK